MSCLRLGASLSATALALWLGPPDASAMSSVPAERVETGAPGFVVLGPEALGLSTTPTDLHLLSDGRILVVAQHELSFGDGLRWDTFRGTPDQPNLLQQVAIGTDDRIYAGTFGGVSRIDLIDGERWKFAPAATFPAPANEQLVGYATTLGEQWLWYGGGDPVLSWRPGTAPRVTGLFGTIERVFALNEEVFLSASSGRLFRLQPDGTHSEVSAAPGLVGEMITCAVPFSPGSMLVGTVSTGLRLFDGKQFRPFVSSGWLGGERRITDLCRVGDDFFAAAVDTFGIVLFNREGRIVQALDRSLDHRLARPQRVVYSSNGVLWVLLNGGVARVAFPSQLSHYEPLLTSGLDYPLPLRHAGDLWVLGDGRAMRADYDQAGRLVRFVDETPPGGYLFTLEDIHGRLFGTNEHGIFLHRRTGWQEIFAGISNARIVPNPTSPQTFHYVARGEYGTIRETSSGYTIERFPVPELRESYGSAIDANHVAWFELGSGSVGRLDPRGQQPSFRLLGREAGLEPDWVEIYVLEGVARFHLRHLHLRFDDNQQRFVDDRDLREKWPQLANAGGRPLLDPLGRLWFTADGAPHAIDQNAPGGPRAINLPPIDFFPTRYVVEDEGIAWLADRRRLVRVDLRMPAPPTPSIRTLITSVVFPATNRQLFSPATSLGSISHSDSSLMFHFAAPANPFGRPLTFEVLLEGADSRWISTGSVGRAAFGGLKEGAYVFRVRAVQADGRHAAEARVEFSVQPPWYRTRLAWSIYVASALGFVLSAAWLSSLLERREKRRLEKLVTARTSELHEINRQLQTQIVATSEKSVALAASEERYRNLNAELEDRVATRTSQLSDSNRELQHREMLFRLVLENAPVGIAWQRADVDEAFHFNSTFLQILGIPRDAAFDYKDLAALVHPEDRLRQQELSARIESGVADTYRLDERFIRADGRVVWGSFLMAVVRDADGRIIQHISILEDISDRKAAEQELATTYKDLVNTSRIAGMAEVATGVLHNVGNVLTSLNVSAHALSERVRQTKFDLLGKLSALVDEHAGQLDEFFASDPKGRMVPEMLRMIAHHAEEHRTLLLQEIGGVLTSIDHIKDIVVMQQNYATMGGVMEVLDPRTLMDDAIRMNEATLANHQIAIVRDYRETARVSVEKGKALQILINLIRNANHACTEFTAPEGRIVTLTVAPGGPGRVIFQVRDNGIGIATENLARIFSYGFTTRAHGHGFGLHSSALAAAEMQGSLQATSDGPHRGATFVLDLPLAPTTPGNSSHQRTFPEPAALRYSSESRQDSTPTSSAANSS